jgi:hypothetical protein
VIMDGRTCVPVGAGLLMLMGNLEDAARAIQPDDDDDPMPDDLGLVESHPDRRVQCVIDLIASLINRKGRSQLRRNIQSAAGLVPE